MMLISSICFVLHFVWFSLQIWKARSCILQALPKVQMDEQMCMALQVIKQGGDEKMKVYYEHIFKLANCFQCQEDSLLTTFFQTCLQPYL